MSQPLRNWAGNIAYAAASLRAPHSLAELQDVVRMAPGLRPLGSRHSFNAIADTDGELVSLEHLDRVLAIDPAARTVTVEGGIRYGQLAPVLDAAGFALHNLASLPHISVAGAIATATHGSGNANRNLAAAVRGLEIVTASGDVVALKRGDADFEGAVVSLGALGVVARLTLDIVPRFDIRQVVYVDLPFDSLVENFEAISAKGYSVSVFTPWRDGDSIQVWVKSLADAPLHDADLAGATASSRPLHPIPALDPTPCTEQRGVSGPWHERLPHFKFAFQPSAGAELQSEYFVARSDAAAAIRAVHAVRETFAPLLLISEIRTIAADQLWLSPSYRTDSVALHFTWRLDWPGVSRVLPVIEAALAPFGARPHWGKLFAMPPADIRARSPRFAGFRALAGRLDPTAKFRNAFLDRLLG